MAQGILVFMEERDGKIKKTSLEALYAARKLADQLKEPVVALRIGSGETSANLAHYGADRVLNAQHVLLKSYSTEGYCAAVAQAAEKTEPRFILGAAGFMGRDLLPRVAARLRVGLAQDCIEIRIVDGQQLECVRPIYAGKAFARVRLTMVPAMATLRPNVFSLGAADTSRTAGMEAFTPELNDGQIHASVKETKASAGQKVELTEANIIVSGKGNERTREFPDSRAACGRLGGSYGRLPCCGGCRLD